MNVSTTIPVTIEIRRSRLSIRRERSVGAGSRLSQTEERIVLLVAQGRSRREIAAVVGLDLRTVDWYLAQANGKLEKASALLDRVRDIDNEGRKS